VWPLIVGALVGAAAHLALILGSGDTPPAGGLALVRALLASVDLLGMGLCPALLLLGRRGERPSPAVGAFELLSVSLGLSLLLHLGLAAALQVSGIGYRALPASVATVGSLVLAAVVNRRRGGVALELEPGLGGAPLALALAALAALAVVQGERLFGGPGRLVLVQPVQWLPMLTRTALGPLPASVEVSAGAGLEVLGPGHYRVTSPRASLTLRNRAALTTGPLRLVLTGPAGARLEVAGVTRGACQGREGGPGAAGGTTPLGAVQLPRRIEQLELSRYLPRARALLVAWARLHVGDSCAHLRLTGATGEVELHDVSHEPPTRLEVAGGRLSLVDEGLLECHLSDARYRRDLQRKIFIEPHLLLGGYLTQLVVQVLSGGAAHPGLGVLFLLLALLSFMGAQVLIGAASSPGPGRATAGWLLLAPFCAYLVCLSGSRALAFAFPDIPYTFLVVSAAALLARRRRLGFVLLGCLAALTRYPGAFVMALLLLGRLALLPGDRAWTRRTVAVALAAGAGAVALLLAYFHATTGVEHLLSAAYSEIFPEHFTVPASSLVRVPPAWARGLLFMLKLCLLAAFTPLLWPLCRSGQARALVITCAGYMLTLMWVVYPNPHYFPPLIFLGGAAGLAGLADTPRPLLRRAGVALVLAGAALSPWADRAVLFFYRP